MTDKRSKYQVLLNTPDIRRWHTNVARGSKITADVYLRRLGAFSADVKITPESLLNKNPREIFNIFEDYITDQEKAGLSGAYIESTLKAAKSWLAFNDIEVKQVKIRGVNERHTLDNEQNPTQPELKRILLAATMRDRVSCVLMAHSGIRPGVLGNNDGSDGLRVRDFPEMILEGGKISFKEMPTKLIVRSELSKARNSYFTFLSEEGCEYLKAYLEYRISTGEEITPDTDIIAPKTWSKHFITTTNAGDGIRSAIRKAGFNLRPYVLRSYFDTQLLLAESKGKITNQYRKFFMGHVGDMEARYTTNKKRLPDEVIIDMREAYKRCQPYLQTNSPGLSEDQVNLNTTKRSLLLLGFSEEQLNKMDLASKTVEDIQAMVREKLLGVLTNNGNSQKVIMESELEKYLAEGWTYVDKINGNKVIIKLPH